MNSEIAAQGQLDAYNNRDIEDFMRWYALDIRAYDLDNDKQMFEGHSLMRARYEKLFENVHLHCELKNRMVLGATVIDHESVTLREGEERIQVIAIYDVNEAGLIQTVRFTRGKI